MLLANRLLASLDSYVVLRRLFGALRQAERHELDPVDVVAASDTAYGDMRRLPALANRATTRDLTRPLWLEYIASDRNDWYGRKGLPVAPDELIPDRIGLLAFRDEDGRMVLRHAFLRHQQIELNPWDVHLYRLNETIPTHETELGRDIAFEGDRTHLADGEYDAVIAMNRRFGYVENPFGDVMWTIMGRSPQGRDVLQATRMGTLNEARDEAIFALGVLAGCRLATPETASQ